MTSDITRPIDAEKQYRMYYLRGDTRLSYWVIFVWLITVVIFIPVDFFALGASPVFYIFMFARLAFTVTNLAILFALWRAPSPKRYDVLISIIMFLAFVFFTIGAKTLDQDFVGQLIMTELVIISIYAIIPAPLGVKISVGMLFSLELTSLLFEQAPSPLISRASILTGLVATNILGIISWSAISQFRHTQFNIQTELEQAKQRAEILARTDPLTEAYNRRAFIERGEQEFARAVRYQRNLSLIMFDLDNFKSINDRYGHPTGDIVLKRFTQQFAHEIRSQDMLARLGGDEFGLLLPEANQESAQQTAKRICEEFYKTAISFNGHTLHASISAGVSTLTPTDESFGVLLQRADQKLYQFKRARKNQIQT